MKHKYISPRIFSLILSLMAGLFVGCSDETDGPATGDPTSPAGILMLSVPDMVTGEITTRAEATEVERMITSAYILVFDGPEDGEAVCKGYKKITSDHIKDSGTTNPYFILEDDLVLEENDRIHVICNRSANLLMGNLEGMKEKDIDSKFLFTLLSSSDPIPMYGKITYYQPGRSLCTLTRAVARVDVEVKLPQEWSVYRLENRVPYYGRIVAPSNGGMNSEINDNRLVKGIISTGSIYLPEFESGKYGLFTGSGSISIDSAVFNPLRPSLGILINYTTNSDRYMYYRLDFFDGEKFIDLKRNHSYKLTLDLTKNDHNRYGFGYLPEYDMSKTGYLTDEGIVPTLDKSEFSSFYNPFNVPYTLSVDGADYKYIEARNNYSLALSANELAIAPGGSTTLRIQAIGGTRPDSFNPEAADRSDMFNRIKIVNNNSLSITPITICSAETFAVEGETEVTFSLPAGQSIPAEGETVWVQLGAICSEVHLTALP